MYLPSIISPIIKVTNRCNLNCEFCHYSHIKGDSDMNIQLCKNIIKQVIEYNIASGKECTTIVFHGGEPLMRGLAFFKKIVDYEAFLLKQVKNHKIINSIQTNGTLLDSKWIEFFSKYNFNVGISLDGDKELNFHRHNNFNVNKIIDNYKKMELAGISCGIISVITPSHIDKAKQYYDFCIKNDIEKIGLRYCYIHDKNGSVSNEGLKNFLIELYKYYFESKNYIDIREFRTILEKILTKSTNFCELDNRKSCGGFLTFDEIGNVYFCDFVYDKQKIIGNIVNSNLNNIIIGSNYQSEKKKCMDNIMQCKETCSVYDICGGGCYRHDSNGKNYFCSMYKEFYKYIINDLKKKYNL